MWLLLRNKVGFGLTSLTLVFTLLHALLVCHMGCFLPSSRLLAFEKSVEGWRFVQKSTFDQTRFGIQVHKFSLICTVTTKVDCNIAQTLRYHLVKGSARCIVKNHNYGGKFKTWLRFDVLRCKWPEFCIIKMGWNWAWVMAFPWGGVQQAITKSL